ncbi:class I SAM-dependent methyltransferase [Myxococcus faecalis]|uniref:class I SAM-dependent methyltransferase n=1 Tax=Myxococcus TaxID=32 RepID=UPI001CBAB420|nr:class I SAM-dependent methyltransferase [Myxococcus sp. XM-1-1-1]MBZ4413735.1 class I SAM-dependent methyltransferase [Myxococcus sp. XM-1-1-1]
MSDNHNEYIPYEPSADIAAALVFGAAWPGAQVLEIGCGIGDDALFLAESGCRVTAFDRSELCVAYARSRRKWLRNQIEHKCTFSVGDHRDLMKLAKLNKSFDLVSDRLVFSNIGNQRIRTSYLKHIAHLVRRGGIFFLRVGTEPIATAFAKLNFTPTDKATLEELFQPVDFWVGRRGASTPRRTSLPGRWMPMLPTRGGYSAAAAVFLLEAKTHQGASKPVRRA